MQDPTLFLRRLPIRLLPLLHLHLSAGVGQKRKKREKKKENMLRGRSLCSLLALSRLTSNGLSSAPLLFSNPQERPLP